MDLLEDFLDAFIEGFLKVFEFFIVVVLGFGTFVFVFISFLGLIGYVAKASIWENIRNYFNKKINN